MPSFTPLMRARVEKIMFENAGQRRWVSALCCLVLTLGVVAVGVALLIYAVHSAYFVNCSNGDGYMCPQNSLREELNNNDKIEVSQSLKDLDRAMLVEADKRKENEEKLRREEDAAQKAILDKVEMVKQQLAEDERKEDTLFNEYNDAEKDVEDVKDAMAQEELEHRMMQMMRMRMQGPPPQPPPQQAAGNQAELLGYIRQMMMARQLQQPSQFQDYPDYAFADNRQSYQMNPFVLMQRQVYILPVEYIEPQAPQFQAQRPQPQFDQIRNVLQQRMVQQRLAQVQRVATQRRQQAMLQRHYQQMEQERQAAAYIAQMRLLQARQEQMVAHHFQQQTTQPEPVEYMMVQDPRQQQAVYEEVPVQSVFTPQQQMVQQQRVMASLSIQDRDQMPIMNVRPDFVQQERQQAGDFLQNGVHPGLIPPPQFADEFNQEGGAIPPPALSSLYNARHQNDLPPPQFANSFNQEHQRDLPPPQFAANFNQEHQRDLPPPPFANSFNFQHQGEVPPPEFADNFNQEHQQDLPPPQFANSFNFQHQGEVPPPEFADNFNQEHQQDLPPPQFASQFNFEHSQDLPPPQFANSFNQEQEQYEPVGLLGRRGENPHADEFEPPAQVAPNDPLLMLPVSQEDKPEPQVLPNEPIFADDQIFSNNDDGLLFFGDEVPTEAEEVPEEEQQFHRLGFYIPVESLPEVVPNEPVMAKETEEETVPFLVDRQVDDPQPLSPLSMYSQYQPNPPAFQAPEEPVGPFTTGEEEAQKQKLDFA